jgi:pilus assembly protein Flp/PilA
MLTFAVFLHERHRRLLRRDDRGVTAFEYGLLVFVIALVIIGAVTLLGPALSSIFHNAATSHGGG